MHFLFVRLKLPIIIARIYMIEFELSEAIVEFSTIDEIKNLWSEVSMPISSFNLLAAAVSTSSPGLG